MEKSTLTSTVFLDIESPEESNSLITAPSALDLKPSLHVAAVSIWVRQRLVILSTRHLLGHLILTLHGIRSGWRLTVGKRAQGQFGVLLLVCLLLGSPLRQVLGTDRVQVDAKNTSRTAELVVHGSEEHLLDSELAQKTGTHDTWLDGYVEDAFIDNVTRHPGIGMDLLAVGVQVAALDILRVVQRGVGPKLGILLPLPLRGSLGRHGRGDMAGLGKGVVRSFTLWAVRKEGGDGHELGVTGAVTRDVGRVHALGDDFVLVDEYTAHRSLVSSESKTGLAYVSHLFRVSTVVSRMLTMSNAWSMNSW